MSCSRQYIVSRNFSRFRVYVELDACKRLLCLDCLDKADFCSIRKASCSEASLLSGFTTFPTLGPLRIVFTLGVTRYTLYGVGCRLYHNGKNSSHGMEQQGQFTQLHYKLPKRENKSNKLRFLQTACRKGKTAKTTSTKRHIARVNGQAPFSPSGTS